MSAPQAQTRHLRPRPRTGPRGATRAANRRGTTPARSQVPGGGWTRGQDLEAYQVYRPSWLPAIYLPVDLAHSPTHQGQLTFERSLPTPHSRRIRVWALPSASTPCWMCLPLQEGWCTLCPGLHRVHRHLHPKATGPSSLGACHPLSAHQPAAATSNHTGTLPASQRSLGF